MQYSVRLRCIALANLQPAYIFDNDNVVYKVVERVDIVFPGVKSAT